MKNMDNQQPRLEKSKVQRLSRKRVLNGNVWETPPNTVKFYVYNLMSSEGTLLYIGSTNDPKRRLSHHVCNSSSHNVLKIEHVEKLYNRGLHIIMNILFEYDDCKKAILKEKDLIIKTRPLLNTTFKKIYYLYDLKENKILTFTQLKDLSKFLNYSSIGVEHITVLRGRYILSKNDNFKNLIKEIATIKLIDVNYNTTYAVSYQHAAWLIKCSSAMINHCLMKVRKSAKGYNIYHIDEEVKEFKKGNDKKIKCLDDNNVFNSLKECSEFYNIDPSSLTKVCRGHRKTIKSLKFNYVDDIVQP